jgi:hypothetical protein|eukprot:g40.t1
MWSYATRSKAPNGTLMAVVTAAVLIEPPEMLILLLSNGSSQTAAEVVAPVAQHIFVEKLSSFLTFLEKYTPIYTDINGIVLNAKWDVPVLTVVCRTMSNGYKATAAAVPAIPPNPNDTNGFPDAWEESFKLSLHKKVWAKNAMA